ncbi:hypothetical protein BFP76_11535 [Amylibacter kogurei]|uniref:DUF304 domain-containing protein n=1 Tax=Paramylibacter kogurei TaxID=1889778 RepID=A0A2G5KCF9_9RHOB|nr:hypothetical protein BFP76_11535 [Amylibacter kogurei]
MLTIPLIDNEQVVHAVDGRIFPTLSDIIMILIFAPALVIAPMLIIHNLFRPIIYVITTKRVLIHEPSGLVDAIDLTKIKHFRGGRKSLLIYADGKRLWLSRIPDAWHFEGVIRNVINKVEMMCKANI